MKKKTLVTNSLQPSSNNTTYLDGNTLISYIYENKDGKLSASDCLKFSGQEWASLYSSILFEMAPASPMAKSVDSCRGVKFAVRQGTR